MKKWGKTTVGRLRKEQQVRRNGCSHVTGEGGRRVEGRFCWIRFDPKTSEHIYKLRGMEVGSGI